MNRRETNLPNVVVVSAKCGKNRKTMGIRYEEMQPSNWVCTWSFKIDEDKARREGYEKSVVKGSFSHGDSFPGCAHCNSQSFVKCDCGSLSCYKEESNTFTCAWCGIQGL